MPLVAPSLLSADFGALFRDVAVVDAAGADWMHLDVMDGHFVPNLTIGPAVVRAIRPASPKPFDVHLMVSHPREFAPRFAEAGADLISFHLECDDPPVEVIRAVRALGKQVGVALKPATPVSAVRDLLPSVDLVLVMSVEPGFGGQAFLPSALPKAEELRRLRAASGLGFRIEMDGGLDRSTAPQALAAGVDVLVAGTAVFGAPEWGAAIAALRGAGRV